MDSVFGQCKKYGLPLWQCPQFLFLIMGLIIIASTLLAYAIGTRYIEDPFSVALIVIAVAVVLFVIAFVITQSFDKLAEANRIKSEFISIVSHQLRSPLSNLKWAVEILMSGRLGKMEEKQIEYFQILKENSARMHDLVSDLLTVSKIEMAQLSFKKQDFSLEDLTSSLIHKSKLFAEASNVRLDFQKAENLPNVLADHSQIQLVLENLLDNAVRYTKGGGEIKISLLKNKNHIRFEIKDSGVGIPKEDQKHIFQKFFRSQNALRSQTEGSGLGLYIAKAIVEKSKGKIGFKSQEGKGSTFWFTLPVK